MSRKSIKLLPSKFLSIHRLNRTTGYVRRGSLQNSFLTQNINEWTALSHISAHPRYSTTKIGFTKHHKQLEVIEFMVTNLHKSGEKYDRDRVLRILRSNDTETKKTWDIVQDMKGRKIDNTCRVEHYLEIVPRKVISLLLPADYPQSVAKGYLGFISFCFTASIAGSAAMVLSTQTLLLAVGIVGQSSATSSGVMAGALNWVMKDFVGQLGGIVFASQMGKTKAFDNDPKRWRMMAAIALDSATILEILSPLCHQSLILPVASIANIGKNIGFLTASASRAALHQSLATTGNLGDVTVKAGSQSMMASLVGTSLGIGLSILLHHDTFNFGICFLCLSAIHQGCTFLSLQNVSLTHFNRHRLHLVIEYYLKYQRVPSPIDVAKIERFFPFFASDPSSGWLHVGRALRDVCRDPSELEMSLASAPAEAYLIQINKNSYDVDLIFFTDAKEKDIYRGVYHACLIRHEMGQVAAGSGPTTTRISHVCVDKVTHGDPFARDVEIEKLTRQTHIKVIEYFPHLFEQLHSKGWDISSGLTDFEGKNAHRIQISKI